MRNTKSNNQLASLKDDVKLESIASVWIEKVLEILNSERERIYIPELVFLISHDDISLFLRDKLKKRDFSILLADYKKIKSHNFKSDLDFRLILMFLDNLYKI